MIKEKSYLEKLMIKQMLVEMDTGRHLFSEFIENQTDLKNMCCKVTPEFEEHVKNTALLLGISKTRFIEAALITAMDAFNSVADDTGFTDYLNQNSKES